MPDTPSGYHSRRRYDYRHPQHRRSRGGALARSRGGCQGCGYKPAEHAHHWALRYLPPEETTSDHLTALCCVCHRVMTLLRRFLSLGGDPARFLAILEAALAEAGETVPRTGRALRLRRGYGARVAGRTRPQSRRASAGDAALGRVGLPAGVGGRGQRPWALVRADVVAEGVGALREPPRRRSACRRR